MVFPDWPAGRASELIAAKWRFLLIKIVAGIESAVSQEFICGTMQRVRARACDSVHDSAGRSAIFGGISIGDYRELLNGINTKIYSQRASGSSICIVIDADAIEPIVVLPGAA